jgi:hypothetical protein
MKRCAGLQAPDLGAQPFDFQAQLADPLVSGVGPHANLRGPAYYH